MMGVGIFLLFFLLGAIDPLMYNAVPYSYRETFPEKLRQNLPGSGIYMYIHFRIFKNKHK